MIAFSFLVLLLILLLIGLPIGFVLLIVGSGGIIVISGFDSLNGMLSTAVYRSVNSFSLTTVPLFILMAHFISKSRVAEDLFDCILKWVGHAPGGAGLATVFSSAGFGALSGSSVAATSIMSQIAVPQMVKARYSESFAAGLIASCTGTLAVMIPPSIPLVVYAIQTENSIGKLLIAGIFPGLLLAALLSITVVIVAVKNNSKTERYSWKERFSSLKYIWPIAVLVIFMLSLIFFGITTTTEAAAFGAAGALVLGLAMKRLKVNLIIEALQLTVKSTSMIFTIIIGAHLFSYFIALTRVGNTIINAIEQSGLPAWSVLGLVIITYLILGMFLDLIGSLLLTLPLVYPLLTGLGYDPIWLGVIIVLLLEIGLVTPPVGINLFITSQHSGVSVQKIIVGSLPFIGVLLLTIFILILFPQIVLYLPNL
ncbi:TRAP transporter large permease [Mesobacillus harenae]|uniref:TRAP transporter large permease n=1 Tax=Mesobacillus harenae TaxID=2213203 RepID=UPI0015812BAE|nr:TRAP transporter large permease [Mesobacillus harenae]